jgi:ZIP family zinc transporter
LNGYLIVLGLAALPAVANFLGGLLAKVVILAPRVLSLAFQWVAEMLLGVVGLELMTRALLPLNRRWWATVDGIMKTC